LKNNDNINHPEHYQGKRECIDIMIDLFGIEAVIGFCKCNIFKYRFRADKKNGEEDILKAQWYENKLSELLNIKRDYIKMDKCSKCLNRKNCIDGANYRAAEKCNKYISEAEKRNRLNIAANRL